MTAEQAPLLVQQHNNRQLFSDYYLNEQLPGHLDWKALAREAEPIMQEIGTLLDQFVPTSNEAQTERNLIQPVLDLLGYDYLVQASLQAPGGAKRPDYMFYQTDQARREHFGLTLNEEMLAGQAIAVGDAKHWDRNLDVALKGAADPFTNKNPSYQIAFYIQHSGLDWGILTNGRKWRLYHKDTAHKLDRYYEIDLDELARSGDPEAFLYFYAFFRRQAFEPGPLGLNTILRASEDYAQGVGESIKNQAFTAVRHLTQGFLDYAPNRLETDPDSLKAMYDNSLIILYRLFFIFYAEARGLLPLRESTDYRDTYSLYAITRKIARDKQHGRNFLPNSIATWSQLKDLFTIINDGSPPLNVATFNGGLFDPEQHPFLEQYNVGDAHLREALDILARVGGEFVDYRDLAEQHLGTVYEGLLEYHIQEIEPEDGWRIDIFNDKGERKATGSYYTPNYIVRYIVEQTVGPVLDAAIEGRKTDQEKIQAILDVNVLDPAMGSGYFLVEATEFIARFLVDNIEEVDAGPDEEPDVAYWKRRVVQSCIYGVDLNPLAVDLAKLSLWLSTVAKDQPLSFLDHHLRTGNSLIGARVADLDSPEPPAAKGRKTKRRNEETRAAAAGQVSMLEDEAFRLALSSAVGNMWLIQERESTTVGDVKEQERIYSELRRDLVRKYAGMANLVTAAQFGEEIPSAFWQPMLDYTAGRSAVLPPSVQQQLNDIRELARQERFFHWELEFPEVFFDRNGYWRGDAAGFDAVVGNPPYIRQERLRRYKPYFQGKFESYASSADIYIYFFEQGIELVHADGRLGYISSGTFARGNFAKPFRKWLPQNAQLETIIDFGDTQPFRGAEIIRPTVLILQSGEHAGQFRGLLIETITNDSLRYRLAREGYVSEQEILDEDEWIFQRSELTQLYRKLQTRSWKTLGEVAQNRVYRGLTTGLESAFVLDEFAADSILPKLSRRERGFLQQMVRGEDLRPWYLEDEGRWILTIPNGWTRSTYGETACEGVVWDRFSADFPTISAYLLEYRDAARQRHDQGEFWWELRSCDYYDEFVEPKIFWPDITKFPRFSWDTSGIYTTTKAYFIAGVERWLLGFLQSRVNWFNIVQICQPLSVRKGLWVYQLKPFYMVRLPVPDLSDSDREYLGNLAMQTTDLAKSRYALHERVRNRVLTDLAPPDRQKLNQKLTRWWELDFPQFREQVKRHLKQEIPLAERDQWQEWLDAQRAEHDRLTAEIVRLETELNDCVYTLFNLNEDEIALIEEVTKYEYGEV